MARNNARFEAVKVVAKPTTARFKTKSGHAFSFKATEPIKQVVRFRAKAK